MKKITFILSLIAVFAVQSLLAQENFFFSKTVEGSFEEIVDRTKSSFKKEGFGVITEIDMDVTLKEKLKDVDMRPYKILGVCNPGFAYQTLQIEENIGVFLPCKAIVKDLGDGSIEIVVVNPAALMGMLNKAELVPIAQEVADKFQVALKML
jgi:uncharacterized protein (DUF302 family)